MKLSLKLMLTTGSTLLATTALSSGAYAYNFGSSDCQGIPFGKGGLACVLYCDVLDCADEAKSAHWCHFFQGAYQRIRTHYNEDPVLPCEEPPELTCACEDEFPEEWGTVISAFVSNCANVVYTPGSEIGEGRVSDNIGNRLESFIDPYQCDVALNNSSIINGPFGPLTQQQAEDCDTRFEEIAQEIQNNCD